MKLSQTAEKQELATYVLKKIPAKGIIGLGSGTTVNEVIRALARDPRAKENLKVIPGSLQTKLLLHEHGFHVTDLWENPEPQIVIDGADQIDSNKNMIKGGGGALLREKILASVANDYVILCDHTKHVNILGGDVLLPIEVLPYGGNVLLKRLRSMGWDGRIRREPRGNPFRTDNGNIVIDIRINEILDVQEIDKTLMQFPEVLVTGLFYEKKPTVITFQKEELIEY